MDDGLGGMSLRCIVTERHRAGDGWMEGSEIKEARLADE